MSLPHSEGPWRTDDARPHVVTDMQGHVVAVMASAIPHGKKAPGNARLTAHAPAMHDALQKCYARSCAVLLMLESAGCDAGIVGDERAWAESLRRLIADALGR